MLLERHITISFAPAKSIFLLHAFPLCHKEILSESKVKSFVSSTDNVQERNREGLDREAIQPGGMYVEEP